MRITSKGQVTIPLPIRRQLGLHPATEVEFAIAGNAVLIRKARSRPGSGQRLVRHLSGRGGVKMSTDEILALTRR
ncbi:MAG: AbrB/MazE/SpoVT family DNA-binding domain-containing protein [Thermoanaerobaculia bacterium]